MKRTACLLFVFLILIVGISPLLAQDSTTPKSPLKANPFLKNYSFSVYFDTHMYAFGNGDLRDTDTSSKSTVEKTDDDIMIGYLQLGTIFRANLVKDIQFYVDLYKIGYWGNDSAEYTASEPFYIRNIYFTLPLYKTQSKALFLTVGRQRFAMMKEDSAHHNFVITDNIDAVVVNYATKSWGFDTFVDMFSMNAPIDNIYELRGDRHKYTTDYFDGDVNIFRFGFFPYFNLKNTKQSKIIIKPFALFSRVGAVGIGTDNTGGYEQSAAGTSGNTPDNDWLLVGGISTYIKLNKLSLYAEVAYSIGKDRKKETLPDVDISGIMVHFSMAYKISKTLSISAAGLFASGASTDSDGNYKNYGFVGFKGDKLGGFLYRFYYGAYPYAVLNYYGITFEPVAGARRAPVAAATFKLSVENINLSSFKSTGKNEGFSFHLEGWAYFDTSSSDADFSKSLAADVYDQKRFGKFMGYEINIKASHKFYGGVLEAGLEGGIFVPYDYFLYPASDENAPYGNDTFWGLNIYTKLKF